MAPRRSVAPTPRRHDAPVVSISTVRVRYAETDQMGFVYHPHYLVWCEIARTDFIRNLGVSYAELERGGLLLAVINVEVRYMASGRYDDLIDVECRLERVQSRSVTFSYDIVRREPEPSRRLAQVLTQLISLDRSGAPRTLPSELLQSFRDAVGPVDRA
jgi:acyl-CoA thioester hydrolase